MSGKIVHIALKVKDMEFLDQILPGRIRLPRGRDPSQRQERGRARIPSYDRWCDRPRAHGV